MIFVDDKIRYCETVLLKNKSEAFEKFVEFETPVEKQAGKKIKALRSDNDQKYLESEKFKQFFRHST